MRLTKGLQRFNTKWSELKEFFSKITAANEMNTFLANTVSISIYLYIIYLYLNVKEELI